MARPHARNPELLLVPVKPPGKIRTQSYSRFPATPKPCAPLTQPACIVAIEHEEAQRKRKEKAQQTANKNAVNLARPAAWRRRRPHCHLRHSGAGDARARVSGNSAGTQSSVRATNTASITALAAIVCQRLAGHGPASGHASDAAPPRQARRSVLCRSLPRAISDQTRSLWRSADRMELL